MALERDGRVRNRAIRGIADHPCNNCKCLIVFVLAVSCHDAHRRERNVHAERPSNSVSEEDHQKVRFIASIIANLLVRAILSNVILALIY